MSQTNMCAKIAKVIAINNDVRTQKGNVMSNTVQTLNKEIGNKISSSDIRENNINMIFSLLFPSRQLSRVELGKQTGLSRMAVSEVTAEMMADGIIREVGEDHRTGRGKRSTIMSIDTAHWRVCAVDLSNPFIVKGALIDLCGRIVERIEIPKDDSHNVTVDDVIEALDQVRSMTDLPILGMGIAVPGIVDNDGTVIRAVHFGWKNIALGALLEERYELPVLVNNSTDVALLAEQCFGAQSPNAMLIKIGQGIGVSLSLNSEIIEGEHHMAGEIGHVVIDPNGPECVCGKRGCLEAFLAAPRLERMIADAPERRTEILARAGQTLGRVMAVPTGLLDIQDISVYGPSLVGEAFLGAMGEELASALASEYRTMPNIRRCQQGEDLTLRGEGINVIQHCLSRARNVA